MKRYQAIFFDWDGTAVLSRTAPPEQVASAMKLLLSGGIKLCVVSGTTYENIAGGKLHHFYTTAERQNLFLGLARGAQDWAFDKGGERIQLGGVQPKKETLVKIHQVCFNIHQHLFQRYGFNSDLIFSRPNYCKIDLLSGVQRGDHLFFQASDANYLAEQLKFYHFEGGLRGLIKLAEELGSKCGLLVKPTSDAKYLEIGLSTKSDNIDFFMEYLNLNPEDCCFLGDEFLEIQNEVFGSDADMITERTKDSDFFDVSSAAGTRPANVKVLGGGVDMFLKFLLNQADVS